MNNIDLLHKLDEDITNEEYKDINLDNLKINNKSIE